MSDKADDMHISEPRPAGGRSHAEAKAARLKAALRENLRRRKASNTSDGASTPEDHEKATPDES